MKKLIVCSLVLLFAVPAMAGPTISKPTIRQPVPVNVGPISVPPCGVESETINKIIPDALCCQTGGDEAKLACLERNAKSIRYLVTYIAKIRNDADCVYAEMQTACVGSGPYEIGERIKQTIEQVQCEAGQFMDAEKGLTEIIGSICKK